MRRAVSQTDQLRSAKFLADRFAARLFAAAASSGAGRDWVMTVKQEPKSCSVLMTALAMVLIALGSTIGGAIMTWHWNEEKRAAQAEQRATAQRYLQRWKAEMQRTP
jgi:hypothetical protein